MTTSGDVRCIGCGGLVEPLTVVYGFPSNETIAAAQRGEIELGGRIVDELLPDHVCPACGEPMPAAVRPDDEP